MSDPVVSFIDRRLSLLREVLSRIPNPNADVKVEASFIVGDNIRHVSIFGSKGKDLICAALYKEMEELERARTVLTGAI